MGRKYLTSGKEDLIDHCGQHKTEEELSETEKLERRVKILEHQFKEMEMENELLKKFRKSKGGDILQIKKRSEILSDEGTPRNKEI